MQKRWTITNFINFGPEAIYTTLPGKKHYRFSADEAYDRVRTRKDRNVYISPNPRRSDLPLHLRGEDDDVKRHCLCCGYRCRPAHKETCLPPDKDTAVAFLNEMKIKPTGFVIQVRYLWLLHFRTPVSLADDDVRERVKGMLRGFGKMLMSEGLNRGWKLDNVYNISHMFRAPGSLNHKLDEPVACGVMSFDGPRYTIEEFEEYYEKTPTFDREPFEADPETVGSAQRILDRCPFVQNS